MSNDTNGGNLAGEMISEMQKHNPGMFDANGQMSAPTYQPNTGYAPNDAQPQPQSQPQPGVGNQINPQLQKQFMFVLKQDPEIQQKFADPHMLEQALQDTAVMMNAIAFYQQKQKVQRNDKEIDEDDVDDDDNDKNEESAQYEGEVEEIEELKPEESTLDWLVSGIKIPIILTLVYILLSHPFFKEYIIKYIPKLQESTTVYIVLMSIIFFSMAFVFTKVLKI